MAKISVCIDVLEMKKAILFYTKALGFELVHKKGQYTELLTDGLTIYLSENKAGTNPLINGKATRNYERHWTPIHLDVHVSDLDKCVALVVELGGVKEDEKNGDWGSAAFCADPFGNGFCVMQYNN